MCTRRPRPGEGAGFSGLTAAVPGCDGACDGADTFVFASGDGNDSIFDFQDGQDVIDLSTTTSITGFDDLTITQEGSRTVIDLSGHGGGDIQLSQFNLENLDASDFIFYEPPSTTTADGDGDVI